MIRLPYSKIQIYYLFGTEGKKKKIIIRYGLEAGNDTVLKACAVASLFNMGRVCLPEKF